MNIRNALRRRFLLGVMGTNDVAIVLRWMFLGFLAGWVLSSLGWKQLGYSATVAGLSLVYFTIPIGIIVGVIVCYKLSSTRLRQQSARPNTDSGSDYPKNQELTLRMRLKP